MEERKENGKYQSLRDFIERMSGKELNKRAIENLIKAGALDQVAGNRRQKLMVYAEIVDAVNQEKTGFDVLDRGNLLKVASILPQIGQFLVGSISSFAVNVVVLIFILYFMLIGGKKMEQYVNELLPFNETNTQEIVHEINMIVRSNAIGIPLLAVIQGGVAMLGYWIFDAPNILFSGFLPSFP